MLRFFFFPPDRQENKDEQERRELTLIDYLPWDGLVDTLQS